MAECLCPKCGFVWDNDAPPPSDEVKRAVASHLSGKANSIYGAVMADRMPELKRRALVIQGYCDPSDLARRRSERLMASDHITVGGIYAWEPDMPWAAALLRVTKIQRHPNTDVTVETVGTDGQKCWNDFSRCREAFVRTILKMMPTEPI